MCFCENVKIGSYDNQIELQIPDCMADYRELRRREHFPETICVDACLGDEIQELWRQGIKTTGCCCGHNYLPPFIGVEPEFEKRMLHLGYKIQLNENDPKRTDSFIPKSV